ncbi:DUF3137 domain-containing protein [Ahrensia marina]|uniref:DUF3137 domain-containing protein n=1 Tax=Ahrensia marina TaxID=1514904 RepID=UPI0035CF7EEF
MIPNTFTEREPYEAGFADVYEQEIYPYLGDIEKQRASANGKGWLYALATVVGGLLLGALLSAMFDSNGPTVVLGIVSTFVVAPIVYKEVTRNVKLEMYNFLGPILSDFLGGANIEASPQNGYLSEWDRIAASGILPKYRYIEAEEGVTGSWRDVNYSAWEMTLVSGSGKNRINVFKGLVFQIDVPTDMPKTVFLKERGMLTGLAEAFSSARRGMERLEFPNANFEKTYEVYSEDVALAKEKLSPSIGEALLEIARDQLGTERYVGAAFEGHHMFIALTLKHDFLNLGRTSASLVKFDEVLHQLLADLVLPRRIIDALLN